MASSSCSSSSTLYAAIDMGTNSFKMIIIRAYPNGKFLTIDHLREPVVLGLDITATSTSSSTSRNPFTLSAQSQLIAVKALKKFQRTLASYKINKAQIRCVATAVVREAMNKGEFLKLVSDEIGLTIDVLPGEEEARLVYLGMLHFLPIYDKLVLGVDIGGGSTEFVIGKNGKVVYGASLKLGHVILTQKFGDSKENVDKMREYIRMVVKECDLVEKIKGFGFEVVVGSSGTIKAVEKAVFSGYVNKSNVASTGDSKRDWKLSRGDVKVVVEGLCCGGGEAEKIRREEFFTRRSEFIVAGAVLLEEISDVLGIEEMEVSGYALAEGVIAETLGKISDGYDLKANARWSSIVQLAMRFNSKKRMKAAAQTVIISKEILEGLRQCDEAADNQFADSLDDKDLEYLEAASLLHNIGIFMGKEGYHKLSYSIIMNGELSQCYTTQEVKLIALLARHHRKKLPSFNHASFKEFPREIIQKFRLLCAILRVSVALQQHGCIGFIEMEPSYSYDFKLVNCGARDHIFQPYIVNPLAEDIGDELRQELEYFKLVFFKELLIVALSIVSEELRVEDICTKVVA